MPLLKHVSHEKEIGEEESGNSSSEIFG